jgi:hypothetical protein
MAKEEHVKVLKQGTEDWNKWRGENPDIKPNLAGANSINAILQGVLV